MSTGGLRDLKEQSTVGKRYKAIKNNKKRMFIITKNYRKRYKAVSI